MPIRELFKYVGMNSRLGTIQVLRPQRGGWVGSENGNWVGGPKKVKNMMT